VASVFQPRRAGSIAQRTSQRPRRAHQFTSSKDAIRETPLPAAPRPPWHGEAAARALAGRLSGLPRIAADVECAPHGSLNLLAAAAPWAGLDLPADELRTDILVLRARPAPYAATGERGEGDGRRP
jgi:hypothetical protein